MNPHADASFLLPDMFGENSRLSTPRSSVGEGVSTDCDADVESNMSANSEDASPHRRRSSYGIYGIVPANKAAMFIKQTAEKATKTEAKETVASFWKNMIPAHKLALCSSIVILLLFIFGIVFIFPSCKSDCKSDGKPQHSQMDLESKWPLMLHKVVPISKSLLTDINNDGKADLIVALRENVSAEDDTNSSVITAFDGDSGRVLKRMRVNFQPNWINCNSNDKANSSCLIVSKDGIIAKVSMSKELIQWIIQPCAEIHSVSVIKDIDSDQQRDLLVVCSWLSAVDTIISGIALLSTSKGDLVGSKIRYQLNQKPSSFLMQHLDAKNETCILFGTQRNGQSTVLAVRLKRLIEIATGTRNKVNLVSENPLLVAKNVRIDIDPVHADISGDNVKDLGLVLKEGLIIFIDGASLSVRKTINTRDGDIVSISILPTKSFKRPLLAVFKNTKDNCGRAVLNIYDFRNAFDPYTIGLPQESLLVTETELLEKKRFIIWLSSNTNVCERKSEEEVNVSSKQTVSMKDSVSLKSRDSESILADTTIDDFTDDIDIDAIDKDVLDNLREYVGIDDKGVTRHHKLFHLVCNYLLLRFLISYGITTESVLKDFKSTRNHLLNLSNRNLGRALTNQLKGLLAADYDKDGDIPPWFDDVENDIDWLKDLGNQEPFKTRRDVEKATEEGDWHPVKKISVAGLDDNELGITSWRKSLMMPEKLRRALLGKQRPKKHGTSKGTGTPSMKDGKGFKELKEAISGSNTTERKLEKTDLNMMSAITTNASRACILPLPVFKSLEISKTSYKLKNITIQGNKGNGSDKAPHKPQEDEKTHQRVKCSQVSMRVKDMLVHGDYLYYILVYEQSSFKHNTLAQINKIKLT